MANILFITNDPLAIKRPRNDDDDALKCTKRKRISLFSHSNILFDHLLSNSQKQFNLLCRCLIFNQILMQQTSKSRRLAILTLYPKLVITCHIITTPTFYVPKKDLLKMHNNLMKYVAAKLVYNTPKGLFKLAIWYYECEDYKKAADYFKKALILKYLPAYSRLAWLLMIGRVGVHINEETALEIAEEGAEMGCKDCIGICGWIYLSIDPTKATLLAKESSRKKSFYGDTVLAYIQYWGIYREPVNKEQAFNLFSNAAKNGIDLAQDYMSYINRSNPKEVMRWHVLAAKQGYPRAYINLAYLYENGINVERDLEEAKRLYKIVLATELRSIAERALLRIQRLN
jgi:TPR repeat protein